MNKSINFSLCLTMLVLGGFNVFPYQQLNSDTFITTKEAHCQIVDYVYNANLGLKIPIPVGYNLLSLDATEEAKKKILERYKDNPGALNMLLVAAGSNECVSFVKENDYGTNIYLQKLPEHIPLSKTTFEEIKPVLYENLKLIDESILKIEEVKTEDIYINDGLINYVTFNLLSKKGAVQKTYALFAFSPSKVLIATFNCTDVNIKAYGAELFKINK